MKLPWNKNGADSKSLSFGLGGYSIKISEGFITYKSAYGKSFRVAIADVETVSLDQAGLGKNKIKLVGRGTVLAEIDLPKKWAEKTQEFITKEIQEERK